MKGFVDKYKIFTQQCPRIRDWCTTILVQAAAIFLSSVLFYFVPENSAPNVQVIFNEDIQKQLQNVLTLAKKSLKIAVSWFTNYSLFKQVKEIA